MWLVPLLSAVPHCLGRTDDTHPALPDALLPCRPIVTDLGHQYQAPIVTPSPRASGSVSSSDEDHDLAERGTLLPKVCASSCTMLIAQTQEVAGKDKDCSLLLGSSLMLWAACCTAGDYCTRCTQSPMCHNACDAHVCVLGDFAVQCFSLHVLLLIGLACAFLCCCAVLCSGEHQSQAPAQRLQAQQQQQLTQQQWR